MTDYLAMLKAEEQKHARGGDCVNRAKGFAQFVQLPHGKHSERSRVPAIRPAAAETLSSSRSGEAELRRLLTDLMWDAPREVEGEIARTLADGALDEDLAMYRRCYAKYRALGELPTAAEADAHVSEPTVRITERWVDGPLPAVFAWGEEK